MSEQSYIQFSKNGELLPAQFVDIYEGTYHAAISLYMQARCRINLGPTFQFNQSEQAYSELAGTEKCIYALKN